MPTFATVDYSVGSYINRQYCNLESKNKLLSLNKCQQQENSVSLHANNSKHGFVFYFMQAFACSCELCSMQGVLSGLCFSIGTAVKGKERSLVFDETCIAC